MDEFSVKKLLDKYRQGTCTPEERAQLEAWYLSLNADAEPLDTVRLAEATERVERRLSSMKEDARTAARFWRWLRYAAAVVVSVGVATWFIGVKVTPADDPVASVVDVAPGGNKATLTLADGRTITLDESHDGIVVGEKVAYLDGSRIIAEVGDPEGTLSARQQTLSTPKGGMYQITLSDGTKVWLNAASTLTYPSRFVSGERIVELEGEAYFDVTSSDQPFRIISRGQVVEVLGTQFNIRAYVEDRESKTTLVEGGVRLINSFSSNTTQLKPGQQGSIRDGHTDIKQVKVDEYVAWKDGTFYFKNTSPKEAFDQISRWYDVEVLYEGALPTMTFYGLISRDKSLASVLAILKESGLTFELKRMSGKNVLAVKNEL